LVPVEEAVHYLTAAPAELFGLRERGRIEHGFAADIVIFDPDTVGSGPVHVVADMPGGSSRLFAEPLGIRGVYVNGVPSIENGVTTGARAGQLLRSGRDTVTVSAGSRNSYR
jgi:N-acyl-D-aspartate/D-glutamate deacylase